MGAVLKVSGLFCLKLRIHVNSRRAVEQWPSGVRSRTAIVFRKNRKVINFREKLDERRNLSQDLSAVLQSLMLAVKSAIKSFLRNY